MMTRDSHAESALVYPECEKPEVSFLELVPGDAIAGRSSGALSATAALHHLLHHLHHHLAAALSGRCEVLADAHDRLRELLEPLEQHGVERRARRDAPAGDLIEDRERDGRELAAAVWLRGSLAHGSPRQGGRRRQGRRRRR